MTMPRDNVFGDDRDEPPGVHLVPGQLPPQVTDWMTESAVMHSKSEGWMPCIVLRIATDDGAGLVATIPFGPELFDIVDGMINAVERAPEDLKAAQRNGFTIG
jgi:hypothetical protein